MRTMNGVVLGDQVGLIGDVHGDDRHDSVVTLTPRGCNSSVRLGDFGMICASRDAAGSSGWDHIWSPLPAPISRPLSAPRRLSGAGREYRPVRTDIDEIRDKDVARHFQFVRRHITCSAGTPSSCTTCPAGLRLLRTKSASVEAV